MCRESDERVHEHADEHGTYGKRDDVNAEQAVLHEERHRHGIDGYYHIKHHHRAHLTEILRPKQQDEAGEEAQHHQHKDELPDDGVLNLGFRHTAACRFFLQ